MALLSLFFHCSATSFARGSSGLGALNNAWIDSNTVRICRAGDHLSERGKKKKRCKRRQKKRRKRSQLWGQICKMRETSGWCSIYIWGYSSHSMSLTEAPSSIHQTRAEAGQELPCDPLFPWWRRTTPTPWINNKLWAGDKRSVPPNHSVETFFSLSNRKFGKPSAVVCSALAKQTLHLEFCLPQNLI